MCAPRAFLGIAVSTRYAAKKTNRIENTDKPQATQPQKRFHLTSILVPSPQVSLLLVNTSSQLNKGQLKTAASAAVPIPSPAQMSANTLTRPNGFSNAALAAILRWFNTPRSSASIISVHIPAVINSSRSSVISESFPVWSFMLSRTQSSPAWIDNINMARSTPTIMTYIGVTLKGFRGKTRFFLGLRLHRSKNPKRPAPIDPNTAPMSPLGALSIVVSNGPP